MWEICLVYTKGSLILESEDPQHVINRNTQRSLTSESL